MSKVQLVESMAFSPDKTTGEKPEKNKVTDPIWAGRNELCLELSIGISVKTRTIYLLYMEVIFFCITDQHQPCKACGTINPDSLPGEILN